MGLMPQLGMARARVDRSLDVPCAIVRGGVALALAMPDGSPLRCSVSADSTESRVGVVPALQQIRRWAIRLPASTPIIVGDRIVTAMGTYAAVQLASGESYNVDSLAYAYLVYDAAGDMVYFAPNAIVNVSRRQGYDPATGKTPAPSPVPGLQGIPIFVADMANQLKEGGIAATFSLEILFDGTYGIVDGDMLSGYNPLNLARIPTLTVQHVNPTSPAGIPVRSALVEVQG